MPTPPDFPGKLQFLPVYWKNCENYWILYKLQFRVSDRVGCAYCTGRYAVPISASSKYSRSKFVYTQQSVSLALTLITLYTAHVLYLACMMTDDDVIIMMSFSYFINKILPYYMENQGKPG